MRSAIVPVSLLLITYLFFLGIRSTAVRKAIHFVNLWTAGRSSGNLAMNSVPKPALGSETSWREDFAVGDKDAVVIVDHGSRRQESNLMLSNKPDFCKAYLLQSWCFYCVLICVLTNADDFVEMFRAKTSYSIVEAAHMVFFVALAFLYLLFFLCEKGKHLIY